MTGNKIQRIKAQELNVDPMVQRGLNTVKMNKIRDTWDDTLVGVLVVSQRGDGTYYVIEGQHRLAAAMDHPELGGAYEFLCEVYTGLTLAQEAQMFRGINTLRSLPSAYDRYRVSLVAGDESAILIDDVLKELDLKAGASATNDTVGCVQALTRVVEKFGKETLHNSLSVLIAAFGRAADTYDADLLQGVAHLIGTNERVDFKRLTSKLAGRGRTKFSPGDWKRQVASIGKMGGSTSRSSVIRRILMEAYNNGIKEEKWLR